MWTDARLARAAPCLCAAWVLLACSTPKDPAADPKPPGELIVHRGEPPVLCVIDAGGGTPRCDDVSGRFAGPVHGRDVVVIDTRDEEGVHKERLIRWRQPGETETLALTPWAPQVRSPEWSPDGARIATATTLDGLPQLFSVQTSEQGAPTLLHDHMGGSFEPVWDPSSEALYFASSRDGNAEIYRLARPESGLEPQRITDHPADDLRPRVSRKGLLAWLSERRGSREAFVLRDGTPTVLLTDHRLPQVDLAWSPTGDRLAVLTGEGPDSAHILVVDATTSDILATIGADGERALEHPTWSPDGSWLAMTCRRGERSEICTVPASGGRLHPITQGDSSWWLPRWRASAPDAP